MLLATPLVGWSPPQLWLTGDATLDGELPEDIGAVTALYLRFDNDGANPTDTALVVVDEGSPVANHATAMNGPMYSSYTFGSPVPQTGDANMLALSLASVAEQYLTVPYHPSLSFAGGSFTIEAWVRLNDLASGTGPQDRAWLVVKKEHGEGDETIEYALLVQAGAAVLSSNAFGKSEGFTGNELAVILGDTIAAGQWALLSNLEITDSDWHFVAVTVDTEQQRARFVLDEQVDEFDFVDQGHTFNQGLVVVGAHPNAAGLYETPMDADIDEIRISRGAVPEERQLERTGTGTNDGGSTWVMDFGTVELGSAPLELTLSVTNDGGDGCYTMEGAADATAISDGRLTASELDFEDLDQGQGSATLTVTLDPATAGDLIDQELVIEATATTYGFHALGSPARVLITGTVEDPAAGDDDTTAADDDTTAADDDDPEYAEGCSCRSDGRSAVGIVAWLLLGAAGLVSARLRPRRSP